MLEKRNRSRWLPALLLLGAAACRHEPPSRQQPEQVPKVVKADGRGESTAARVGPSDGRPVETAPPNVPELEPAFPGQTRAPGIHTAHRFVVDVLAKELKLPWALAFLPDGRLLLTEKHAGQLLVLSADGQRRAAVSGVPKVDGRGQGGLLDVELSPDFPATKRLFLSYYEPRDGGNGLAVASARFVDGRAPKLEKLEVIFRMQPTLDSTMHAGGRLVFAADGTLFITLGERSILPGRVQARDLASDFGKIVRNVPDGQIPKDNPFVARPGARPEIWSLGHRNVLGAALDDRQRLWVAEMGPRGGDELNLVARGKDYGWPTIGYGEEYSGERIHRTAQAPGLEQPVYYWDPVISPGALLIYSGSLFPEWRGSFFIAGLSSKALIRLVLKDDRVVGEERLLTERESRLREVVQAPDGAIYVLSDDDSAVLLRLRPDAR
jgi:glucose/arabinose dehydrogenase